MKVLQITNSLMSGGAEKLIAETSIRYTNKGIDTDILLMDGTKTSFYQSVSAHKNITIIGLGERKNIYNPLNIFRIIKYFKKYDIIHVHLFPALYWVAFAKIISFSNKKLIVTEHNSTNRRRNNPILKFIDKIVYPQYHTIVTISEAVDKNIREHLNGKHSNFKKINNGIDLATFENAIPYTKSELNFKESDKLIIQVSSFTPQKDQKTLIKLLKELPEAFQLILVGDGVLIDEHKELAQKIGVENRVYFLGLRSDVPRLLKSADFVILSSNYEGLSLSSVEGMACGKPFLASDAPGLNEVVENAGVLFPIGDYSYLKERILELTHNTEKYNEVAKKCQSRAKDFDINLMINKHIELYKLVIS